ncbi:MAG TPA: hypothetical protein VL461_07035 [Dictyobacter sp.]|jgi:HEAT repeat protein|nr:hypothetical protein [Dictyobacter sp.]
MTSIDLFDDEALQKLTEELSRSDWAIDISAIHRSVLFKEKAPRWQLLNLIRSSRTEVREAAAEAIEQLKPWMTDEQWLETLQGRYFRVSLAAIDVLDALGAKAPLLPLLMSTTSGNQYIRSKAQAIVKRELSRIPQAQVNHIIKSFSEILQQHEESHRRTVAVEILGIVGNKGDVPAQLFMEALKDPDAGVRLAALKQLRARWGAGW